MTYTGNQEGLLTIIATTDVSPEQLYEAFEDEGVCLTGEDVDLSLHRQAGMSILRTEGEGVFCHLVDESTAPVQAEALGNICSDLGIVQIIVEGKETDTDSGAYVFERWVVSNHRSRLTVAKKQILLVEGGLVEQSFENFEELDM